MTTLEAIAQIDNLWEREFAYYLNEHRNPMNRATHMVGIPILVGTMAVSLATLDWKLFIGGQIVGWAFQLLGHRIEGNRPALLKRKISFLMGPMMVLVEMLEHLGMEFEFARRARQVIQLVPA